jgi:molybdenum cofactor cytidylyltransferase
VSRIAGVVLAAGMSRRLGRPKQLLRIGERTLIEHVVERAMSSSLDEIVVVTGAHGEAVKAALDGRHVRIIINERFREGQGTSLAAGIRSLGDEVDAAVVLLGDQPGIASVVIDRVAEARRERGASIVMAEYGLKRGHPVLFGREHFPALMALDGDRGGREIIVRHPSEVSVVPADRKSIPPDIDTEEDWRRVASGGIG